MNKMNDSENNQISLEKISCEKSEDADICEGTLNHCNPENINNNQQQSSQRKQLDTIVE